MPTAGVTGASTLNFAVREIGRRQTFNQVSPGTRPGGRNLLTSIHFNQYNQTLMNKLNN